MPNKNKVPYHVFDEMIRAARGSNPEEQMEKILGRYREKPYYENAIEKARVMLGLREIARRNLENIK